MNKTELKKLQSLDQVLWEAGIACHFANIGDRSSFIRHCSQEP